MKRIIKTVLSAFLIWIMLITGARSAFSIEKYEYTGNDLTAEVDELLSEYDISYGFEDMENLSLSELARGLWDSLESRIKAPVRLMGLLFIVTIMTAFMKSSGESVLKDKPTGNIYNLVCVLSAVAVISPCLLEAYNNAALTIERSGAFMKVYIPVYAAIAIASGGLVTGGIYNGLTLAAAEIIVQLSAEIFMPLIGMTIALGIAGSVFPETALEAIGNLIKKIVTWTMTVTVSLFTGFVALRSTLGNSADGFAAKTTKFVISGFVPVIGSAVSDAYTTVKGSFGILRSTAGMAGIIAISLMILPPLLEILIYRAVLWTGTAAAGVFSVKPLEKLLKNLDSGLAIATGLLVAFGMLFIISTGILMKGTA